MKSEVDEPSPLRLLALVGAALLSAAPAPGGESPAGWARHVIDDRGRGADGARPADVNGDGRPDLATGWEESGLIRVYLHPGKDRVRRPWPAVTVGEVGSPEDAVLVDLDGDRALDVVSACEGKVKSLFVHWAPRDPAQYLESGAWRTEAIPAARGLAQWMFILPLGGEGAGRPDLVVGSKGAGASISRLRGPADPRDLGAWKVERLREAGWIMSLIGADLDGDGDPDVLASDRKGPRRGVFWLENPRSGSGTAGGRPWSEHPIDGDLGEPMFIARADLDGDGRRDVLAAARDSGIDLCFARAGSPAWGLRRLGLPSGCGTAKSVAAGDLDLDGRIDLAFSCEGAAGDRSGVRWLSFAGPPGEGGIKDHEISGPAGTKFDLVQLLDLDEDGDLDLVTTEETEGLGVIWYENPARP